MDPKRRTLIQVKLEDIAATEQNFTTLIGEDVESRRKFIKENTLDVKNLDIQGDPLDGANSASARLSCLIIPCRRRQRRCNNATHE
jgi:hypothetical protein